MKNQPNSVKLSEKLAGELPMCFNLSTYRDIIALILYGVFTAFLKLGANVDDGILILFLMCGDPGQAHELKTRTLSFPYPEIIFNHNC